MTADPAYLLESVEGGERLGRYSFLGVGPRRLLEVRDGLARIQTRPVTVPTSTPRTCRSRRSPAPDPLDAIRALRAAPPRPADRGHAALHRRRRRGAGLRRGLGLRADRAAARARPGRRPDGGVHRDRPRPRLRPPDPHPVGDRLAAHRRARPRGPLPDRRGGDLRGARADARGRAARDGRSSRASRERGAGAAARAGPLGRPVETSLGRDEYIHAVEVAKDAIAAGEAIQVVLARRQSFDLPADPATGAPLDGIGLYRAAPPGQSRARTCSSSGRRPSRSSARRRSCSSRSRATG